MTARGEQSILIKDWQMATKSLLPLPDKWHGLQDVEETYRKRYLDMTMDRSVYQRFITRYSIIKYIREFLDSKDFIEVETPILQNQAGGAMAKVLKLITMIIRCQWSPNAFEHKIIMVGGF